VGKSIPTFIHGSVTSTKPNFNPKTLKFVEKDTNFGKCKFFKIVITPQFLEQSTLNIIQALLMFSAVSVQNFKVLYSVV
jgi:hypothetical protein